MAASLGGGAAVGAVFGVLLKVVLKLKDKATSFGLAFTRLRSTLESLPPLVSKIKQQNNELNRPQEEIKGLVKKKGRLKDSCL